MVLSLRMGHGNPEISYGGSKGKYFQGVCHGNDGGPGLWNCNPYKLFKKKRKYQHIVNMVIIILAVALYLSRLIFFNETYIIAEIITEEKLKNRIHVESDYW